MAVYTKGKKFMGSSGSGANRVRETFKTESEAKLWVADQDAARAALKALPEAPVKPTDTGWTLQQAFDDTSRHIWTEARGGRGKARLNARQALAFFGFDTPCSEITAKWTLEWVEELQDEHQNSGSTINKKLSALSMMLRQAEQFGGLTEVPRFRRYENGEHRTIWFSEAEEAEMLKACDRLGMHELAEFIILGIDTGFRRSELLFLKLADYSGNKVLLHAGATKSGKARSVPIEDRAAVILNAKRDSGAVRVFSMTESTLSRQWDDLRRHLGKSEDPKFIVHCLRHTCATRMATAGAKLDEIRVWMGHGSLSMALRYAHFMPERLGATSALMSASRMAQSQPALVA